MLFISDRAEPSCTCTNLLNEKAFIDTVERASGDSWNLVLRSNTMNLKFRNFLLNISSKFPGRKPKENFYVKNFKGSKFMSLGYFSQHDANCGEFKKALREFVLPLSLPETASLSFQAFIPHKDEPDIANRAIWRFIRLGVPVTLVDDGSSEENLNKLISTWAGNALVSFEILPPKSEMDWRRVLDRIDELALTSSADWIIRCDSDEDIRCPDGTKNITKFITLMDLAGFNIVDTTVVNLTSSLGDLNNADDATHYKFGSHPAHWQVNRAWKNYKEKVNLSLSGGHAVQYQTHSKNIAPFNLTLLHMPLRNEEQANLKIEDRITRGGSERRDLDWHAHYSDDDKQGYLLDANSKLFDSNFWINTFPQRLIRFDLKPNMYE